MARGGPDGSFGATVGSRDRELGTPGEVASTIWATRRAVPVLGKHKDRRREDAA